MARKSREESRQAVASESAQAELALLRGGQSYARGEAATAAMVTELHDPLRELIAVAKGKSKTPHPTVQKVLDLLARIAEANPLIAPQVLLVRSQVERDLLGFASQQEINRINLALLPYAYSILKAVEPPAPPVDISEGSFAAAVIRSGAKLS